jgi:hypothetical protein
MRWLVIALLAADAVLAYRGIRASGLTPGLHVGGPIYWILLAAFELPLLYLVWLQLARPGARAMTFTAGTALTCLVGLLPITIVMTLFSGFAMQIEQLYWLFYLWGFIGALLVTGIAAWAGYFRARQPGERSQWTAAVYAPLLYVIAAHVVVVFTGQAEVGTQASARDNQYNAKDALRQINRCATEAAARPGARGYPESLAELGPAGTGCLDAQLAAGNLRGYAVHDTPGLRGADGRIAIYSTCALPSDYPRGGGLTLASHEDTEDVGENGDAKRAGPMPCEYAWHYYLGAAASLQNLKLCAIRYARERPLEGYPPSLDEIARFGCKLLGEISYRAAREPLPRTAFEATVRGSNFGRHGAFYMNETGIVRFAAQGEASRASTPLKEVLAAEADAMRRQQEQRAAAGREALGRCERGDAAGCDAYAEHLLFDTRQDAEAATYWKRACEAGHALACITLFSNDPQASEGFHASVRFRKMCRDGNPRACEALQRLPGDRSRDAIRALEDWVRQHAG